MTNKYVVGIFLQFVAMHCVGAGYPEKPIRIVTPYPTGSATDLVARPIAAAITAAWGQPVVVDNRPGAGGNLASEIVAKSPPDGYTLLIAAPGPNAVNASLYSKMPYDTLRDFAPITLTSTTYLMLVVHPSTPIRSVKELIAVGKSTPGKLAYGSGGNGSTPHLAAELFGAMTHMSMIHVAYKGGSPQYTIDLVTGRLDVLFGAVLSVLPQVKSGRLRLLAITSNVRDPSLPDVPTISEAGVPGYDVRAWYGLVAPAGTAPATINKLHAEVARIVASPDVKTQYASGGLMATSSSPSEFASYLRSEHEKWAKVVKAANIRLD